MGEFKVGDRLQCESCGSEAIITNPGAAELTCCDRPMKKLG
jgi:Desulfoferrodoxin, N-terminal domain